MGKSLMPRGGDDHVMTPAVVARLVVSHFRPHGRVLEPCRGTGAFSSVMTGCDWAELDEGRDFLLMEGHWDWVVTNPPFSKFRKFLNHSMKVADNVVFLCTVNHLFLTARQRDILNAGFGISEIFFIPRRLLPKAEWPQSGFSVGAAKLERGWFGSTFMNRSLMVPELDVTAV